MSNNIIEMIVEIPKGGKNKYEYDEQKQAFMLDRPLFGANFYPGEYGYIANTLDYDGDPLDVISLITYPTFPGCHIKVRLLGAINMIDNGEIDTKLFGVVASDNRFSNYKTLVDVPNHLKAEITNFFLQYKALQNKKVEIKGWLELDQAWTELKTCQQLYQKYHTKLSTMTKEQLVATLETERNH